MIDVIHKPGGKRGMVKLNRVSTAFISLILFAGIVAIGFAIQNPAILQSLLGIPILVGFLILLRTKKIVIRRFYYPVEEY